MPLRSSEAPKPQLAEADWLKTAGSFHLRAAKLAFQKLELAETKGAQQTIEEKGDQELRDLLAKLKVEYFLTDGNTPRACLALAPNDPTMLEVVNLITTPQNLAVVFSYLHNLLIEKVDEIELKFPPRHASQNINILLWQQIKSQYLLSVLRTPRMPRPVVEIVNKINQFCSISSKNNDLELWISGN